MSIKSDKCILSLSDKDINIMTFQHSGSLNHDVDIKPSRMSAQVSSILASTNFAQKCERFAEFSAYDAADYSPSLSLFTEFLCLVWFQKRNTSGAFVCNDTVRPLSVHLYVWYNSATLLMMIND